MQNHLQRLRGDNQARLLQVSIFFKSRYFAAARDQAIEILEAANLGVHRSGMGILSVTDIIFIQYRTEFGLEVVKMWRRSFQKAMSLEEHNRLDEVGKQLHYLARIELARITVAIDKSTSVIAGFMVLSTNALDHLYVNVEYQGKGVGSRLLDSAKAESPHSLELFTFQKNQKAQSFYVSRGFHEVHRGYADFQDNPWAKSKDDLADIKYKWEP